MTYTKYPEGVQVLKSAHGGYTVTATVDEVGVLTVPFYHSTHKPTPDEAIKALQEEYSRKLEQEYDLSHNHAYF